MACWYAEKMGSVNSEELCSQCKFRRASGGEWQPFAGMVGVLQARKDEKLQRQLTGI